MQICVCVLLNICDCVTEMDEMYVLLLCELTMKNYLFCVNLFPCKILIVHI